LPSGGDLCGQQAVPQPDRVGVPPLGRGEYNYFAHPLSEVVGDLRAAPSPPLFGIANRWNETVGITVRCPDDHAGAGNAKALIGACSAAFFSWPTRRFHGVSVETQVLWMVGRGFSSQARLPGP
jgi:hypothetical protein